MEAFTATVRTNESCYSLQRTGCGEALAGLKNVSGTSGAPAKAARP